MYHLHTFSCTYFYSHPREGGDIEDSNFVERQYISIHAPAKGATTLDLHHQKIRPYFYSRPREGGDFAFIRDLCNEYYISIHAPAKGATGSLYRCFYIFLISIHAPAKGATSTH